MIFHLPYKLTQVISVGSRIFGLINRWSIKQVVFFNKAGDEPETALNPLQFDPSLQNATYLFLLKIIV